MSVFYGKKPRLYGENATDYTTNNGLGYLSDAKECTVTEKLNGGLELKIQYPRTGIGYKNIKINSIIYCPVNPYDNWQPFRVYNISRSHSGIVTVNAEHKAYELSGYPFLPNDSYIETPGTAREMMTALASEVGRTSQALSMPSYTFITDVEATAKWSVDSPTDVWSVMANAAKWYGGEWKYDGTECKLCAQRGENRGVKVQWGSNLATCTQDEVDTSYTHIMPYWTDGTTTVYISGYYMIAPYTEVRMQKRVLVLDLSSEFDNAPTQQDLYDAAYAWALENPPKGVEKNLKVTFVARGQTVEYASLGDIDHVELGDTIDVSANPLEINSTLRCITLVYDVLRGVYQSAELGVVKQSITTATMTVNERTEPTVWVSTTEPTEGYHSGDYWIKIDNNVTRKALALGRFTGGKWLLLCEFGGGGGTGVFLDNAHTSVAHNDTINNTSEGMYDSVDGYDNQLTGTSTVSQTGYVSNGANTVSGQHNRITNSTAMMSSGRRNTIGANSDSSVTTGIDNTFKAVYSFVSGNSFQSSEISCSVALAENSSVLQGVVNSIVDLKGCYMLRIDRSVVVGESIKGSGNNAPAGNIEYSVVVTTNTAITNYIYGCSIFGRNHTIYSCYNDIVGGAGNELHSANNCAVVGYGNYVETDYCIVCGQYGTTVGNVDYYFVVGKGANSSNRENAFTIDANGNVNAAGTIIPGGADYAEYFEWLDGNPDSEDRRGMLVTLDGDRIIPAHGNDFIGVISANPSVVGNNSEMHWHGKYEQDVFGCVLYDEAGKPVISDEYREQKYIPRSQRPEWALVGLVGRLVITDDGSCKPGGYVSARRGKGTSCYACTNARVLRRIDEKHVEVLLK